MTVNSILEEVGGRIKLISVCSYNIKTSAIRIHIHIWQSSDYRDGLSHFWHVPLTSGKFDDWLLFELTSAIKKTHIAYFLIMYMYLIKDLVRERKKRPTRPCTIVRWSVRESHVCIKSFISVSGLCTLFLQWSLPS